MSVLDSPMIEALVFDYVNFGIFTVVNNLWTWVALVTAAVSFWRIRAAGVLVKSEQPPRVSSTEPSPVLETSQAQQPPHSATVIQPPPTPSSFSDNTVGWTISRLFSGFDDVDGVTKGKFTMYYEDDRESDYGNGDDEELPVVGEWGYGGCKEWPESWERVVLRTRIGEMGGWYRFQDLTVINGNVVRLWDDVTRGNYSSSGCVVG